MVKKTVLKEVRIKRGEIEGHIGRNVAPGSMRRAALFVDYVSQRLDRLKIEAFYRALEVPGYPELQTTDWKGGVLVARLVWCFGVRDW